LKFFVEGNTDEKSTVLSDYFEKFTNVELAFRIDEGECSMANYIMPRDLFESYFQIQTNLLGHDNEIIIPSDDIIDNIIFD
jgi:hypothetical protein